MNTDGTKVLIIEDEPDIVEILNYNLAQNGFRVKIENDGSRALEAAVQFRPALILLDLMLPHLDGLEVCRQLKSTEQTKNIPIIMLTAKSEESDIVLGLSLGADDYVTKPFSPKELVARIRAVVRRVGSTGRSPKKVTVSSITVDPDRHEVRIGDKTVAVTRAEFRLLHTLISQQGRVFTRDQLLDSITGGTSVVIDRNVDVHIGTLRKKLGDRGSFIETVRGIGYKFKD